ncbi:MAG: hypothetical protein EBU30_02395 [Synechococcaceae bacterium WB6_3B_236]|nr:hypothetical protein [Synechococcaceae bacterium WB6_3B_236]
MYGNSSFSTLQAGLVGAACHPSGAPAGAHRCPCRWGCRRGIGVISTGKPSGVDGYGGTHGAPAGTSGSANGWPF